MHISNKVRLVCVGGKDRDKVIYPKEDSSLSQKYEWTTGHEYVFWWTESKLFWEHTQEHMGHPPDLRDQLMGQTNVRNVNDKFWMRGDKGDKFKRSTYGIQIWALNSNPR